MKYAFVLILISFCQITWSSSNFEDTKIKLNQTCSIFKDALDQKLTPEQTNTYIEKNLKTAQVGQEIIDTYDAILLVTPSKRAAVFKQAMGELLKDEWHCEAADNLFSSP